MKIPPQSIWNLKSSKIFGFSVVSEGRIVKCRLVYEVVVIRYNGSKKRVTESTVKR